MKILFWNVDTQKDFMELDGTLYVPKVEEIRGELSQLTRLAKKKHITVVSTADWHVDDSKELSIEPDMMETFPEHCMIDTIGAEFIDETKPEDPVIVNWNDDKVHWENLIASREILIRKDLFDVFAGNKWADEIANRLEPDLVIVYGVTTNYSVDMAVTGLVDRVKQVIVVEDAIKHLPAEGEPLNTINRWKEMGVMVKSLGEVKELINNEL